MEPSAQYVVGDDSNTDISWLKRPRGLLAAKSLEDDLRTPGSRGEEKLTWTYMTDLEAATLPAERSDKARSWLCSLGGQREVKLRDGARVGRQKAASHQPTFGDILAV